MGKQKKLQKTIWENYGKQAIKKPRERALF